MLLCFYYYGDNSYLLDNGKEIYKFKVDNKNVIFLTQFCQESISNKFGVIDFRWLS